MNGSSIASVVCPRMRGCPPGGDDRALVLAQQQLELIPGGLQHDVSEAKTQDRRRAEIADWSAQQTPKLVVPLILPVSAEMGAHAVPPKVGGIDRVEWVAPGSRIAQLALSSQTSSQNTLGAMREAWEKVHSLIRKGEQAPFGKVQYERNSWCRRAGFCSHTPHGNLLRLFVVEGLTSCLRVALAPDTPARRAYDSGALCIRLRSTSSELWVYIGYGNLNSFEFTGMPLRLGSELHIRAAKAVGEVALEACVDAPMCGVGNLFRLCKHLRFQRLGPAE
jgi:hypothetical protein